LRKTLAASLGFIFVFLSLSPLAYADTQGVSVSPILEQISLKPNQTATSFTSTVTNHTDSLVTLNLQVKNFSSLNQNGGLNFGNQPNYFQNHGLASSIMPGHSQLVIGPSQTVNDVINITNANKLSPGGHYAAVLYSINAPNQSSQNSVNVNEAIASLIFLSTNGQGYQSLALASPPIGSTSTVYPSSLNLVYENKGNIQSVLSGYVQILNSKKQLISQTVMNTNSNLILPGSDRLFNVHLTSYKNHSFFPKHYFVKVNYGYVGQKNFTTYTSSFYLITRSFIALALILIVFMIALTILVIKWTKTYTLRRLSLQSMATNGQIIENRSARSIPIQELSNTANVAIKTKPKVIKKQRKRLRRSS
jgi:hypothetical protein